MRNLGKHLAIVVATVALFILAMRVFFVATCVVPSRGMSPTLMQGEQLTYNRWSYGFRTPLSMWFGYHRIGEKAVAANDVCVFNNPADYRYKGFGFNSACIGRCLAVPGDTIWTEKDFCIVCKKRDDEHNIPIVIPKKGRTLRVTPQNRALFCNAILLHERLRAEIVKDTLFVEGKPVRRYTFTKDYYWISSDNLLNLSDSRMLGFVPMTHIIGRVKRIVYSNDLSRIGRIVK